MADVDIDPFGKHDRTESRTDESIPLSPVTPGGLTFEPEHEQETSFRGGESQRIKLMKDYVKELYKKLSECEGETSEAFYFDDFYLRDGKLYYKYKSKPLMTNKGVLRSVKEIKKILGKEGLHNLGFFRSEVTGREVEILNNTEEEMPSESDIAKADEKELK